MTTDQEIRASMTSEQIQLERKLTCEAIDGAIAFGHQGTNPPPSDDHWLAPFWNIGTKLREADAAILQAATRDDKHVRPVAMDDAFDALTEWPSMTPRAVFYAGWEAATRDTPSADAVDARVKALQDARNALFHSPSLLEGEIAVRELLHTAKLDAASAPKGDGND